MVWDYFILMRNTLHLTTNLLLMNIVDIILLAFLLWAVYKGFTKGLIYQAASLAALILGIYGAILFSDITSAFLIQKFELTGKYLPIISFTVTFIAIVVMVHLVSFLLDKLVKAVALGIFNRIAGVIFSIVKMAFILSIFLVILNAFDKRFSFMPREQVNSSILYEPIYNFAPRIFPFVKKNIDKIQIDNFKLPQKEVAQFINHQ